MYAINELPSLDYESSYSDPRLISAGHSGQILTLDAPALNGATKMKHVYDTRPGYELVYDSIKDIHGGQIRYYYDSQQGIPFLNQLFDQQAFVKRDYVDPMGTFKPHFYRVESGKTSGCGLTWLADSQFHRQDLMGLQQWKRNQTEPLLKLQNDW